jgi:hypothetical protein
MRAMRKTEAGKRRRRAEGKQMINLDALSPAERRRLLGLTAYRMGVLA